MRNVYPFCLPPNFFFGNTYGLTAERASELGRGGEHENSWISRGDRFNFCFPETCYLLQLP